MLLGVKLFEIGSLGINSKRAGNINGFKMDIARRMNLICLALVMLKLVRARMQGTGGESSGEYLHKAMMELQEFNVPPPVNVYNRLSWNNGYENSAHSGKQDFPVQRINMNPRQKYKNQSYNILTGESPDVHRYDGSFPSYHQASDKS